MKGPTDRAELQRLARNWGPLADRYAELLGDELSYKPFDRALLDRFAAAALPGRLVGDLGCGPGHVSGALASRGLEVVGIDLCPEMVHRARADWPTIEFRVGDLHALDVPDASFGGAVALYSLIHIARADMPAVLAEIARTLQPGAPLLVSVHRGEGTTVSEEVMGEPLTIAATLFEPDELQAWIAAAGFVDLDVLTRGPYEQEYASNRVYVFATRG